MVEKFIAKNALMIAAVFAAVSFGLVILNFPATDMYYAAADEGRYYYQAKTVADEGFAGIKKITDEFIGNPYWHDSPNPLRTVNTLVSAFFIKLNDSYTSLSFLSLLCHLWLLAGMFLFMRNRFGETEAVVAVGLMAFSPLGMGMARRALADSQAVASAATAVFLFITYLQNEKRKTGVAFVAAMVCAILIKETSVLLLPFFAIVSALAFFLNHTRMKWYELFAVVAAPAVLALLNYLAVYGAENFIEVVKIIGKPSAYSAWLGQGPWYRYLIDYISLSPFTTLLSLAAVGLVIAGSQPNRSMVIVFCLAVYLLFAFGFMTKNVRYFMLFDVLLRVAAAVLLVQLLQRFSSLKWAVGLFFVFITSSDVWAFHHYFIRQQIYDPMTYNLLVANRSIPSATAQTKSSTAAQPEEVVQAKKLALEKPGVETYMQLGFAYYSAKLFQESVWAYGEALKFQPDNAVALNNICSAYNEMGLFEKAIEACNSALALQPDFQLAKNNLKWANDLKVKSNQP